MSVGCFLDKSHAPSPSEIEAALGPAFPHWVRLTQFIATSFAIPPDLSYGGKNYGWNLWYRKGGKPLVSLFPQRDHFIAQVVLGKAQVEKVWGLPLGEKVGALVRETPLLHDGKWLWIPVACETDAADVERLLMVKRRPIAPRGDMQ
jgi:hypothetical protein